MPHIPQGADRNFPEYHSPSSRSIRTRLLSSFPPLPRSSHRTSNQPLGPPKRRKLHRPTSSLLRGYGQPPRTLHLKSRFDHGRHTPATRQPLLHNQPRKRHDRSLRRQAMVRRARLLGRRPFRCKYDYDRGRAIAVANHHLR